MSSKAMQFSWVEINSHLTLILTNSLHFSLNTYIPRMHVLRGSRIYMSLTQYAFSCNKHTLCFHQWKFCTILLMSNIFICLNPSFNFNSLYVLPNHITSLIFHAYFKRWSIDLLPPQVFQIECIFLQTHVLSQDTEYSCYLVFKLSQKCRGLHTCIIPWKYKVYSIDLQASVIYMKTTLFRHKGKMDGS